MRLCLMRNAEDAAGVEKWKRPFLPLGSRKGFLGKVPFGEEFQAGAAMTSTARTRTARRAGVKPSWLQPEEIGSSAG